METPTMSWRNQQEVVDVVARTQENCEELRV
jgi:hypothetical protein